MSPRLDTHDQLPLDPAALDRYFAGTAPAADQDRVRLWVAGRPDREALLASLRSAPNGEMPAPRPLDVDAIWQSVRGRVTETPRPRRRAASGRPWVLPLGAAVAAGIALAAMLWFSPVRGVREYATAAGQHTTMTLSDGSTLTLGPASHVRIAIDFGRSDRVVDLQGEALFRVVHDPAHPFVVHVGATTVRDVGTTFVVRRYADDPDLRVGVTEGQVLVGTSPVFAGDLAVVSQGRTVVTHHAELAAMTMWAQGGLAFRGAPLSTVIRDLSRTFDLEISVADSSLLTQHITASFGAEPVDEILAAIALPMGAQVERHGRHVVIRRSTLPAERPRGATPREQPVIHLTTTQESHE